MTQGKHTPGPWVPMGKPTVGFMEVKAQPSPALRGFTKTICHMDGIGTDTKEREANARLIAAAPDMLEALQAWQSVFDALFAAGYPLHQNGKAIDHSALNVAGDMTRAAIARATGEVGR